MEPVPETEQMEEFKDSPASTLRLLEVPPSGIESMEGQTKLVLKLGPRRATEPALASPRSPGSSPTLPYRPRNISPYSRGHLRSRSSASALAPPISRAQSMPGINSAGHLHISNTRRSSSPRGSPHRARTPRKPVDEVFPGLLSRAQPFVESVPAISEDDETPRIHERSCSPSGHISCNTFPRSRRPASPLRNISLQYSTSPTLVSGISSPYQITRFSETISGSYNYLGSATSSSVPSTPSSIRSRSPSISSLETIPDTPDAEAAALEAERIVQLKAAADAADAADGDEAILEAKRTASIDNTWRGRTLGTSYGSRDKRKRWSVCGAERRGDLDLETIWED